MKSVNWTHVIQLVVMVGGGLGAIALGQVQVGVMLIGAAAGSSMPSKFAQKGGVP